MPKKRKTRQEKIRSEFRVKSEWLNKPTEKKQEAKLEMLVGEKYLPMDLTKTLVLTMLALALELAAWLYLSKH